ncbi:hypothetical protein L1049_027284 [Liquidambar formosana]|uniref:Uncharacterized protein n=1 Tax=Liquidambar formosana TaxID=63359 RepID=A0AAP0QYT6_LIQFO
MAAHPSRLLHLHGVTRQTTLPLVCRCSLMQHRWYRQQPLLLIWYGNANVWKIFTDLFDYFPLTALDYR